MTSIRRGPEPNDIIWIGRRLTEKPTVVHVGSAEGVGTGVGEASGVGDVSAVGVASRVGVGVALASTASATSGASTHASASAALRLTSRPLEATARRAARCAGDVVRGVIEEFLNAPLGCEPAEQCCFARCEAIRRHAWHVSEARRFSRGGPPGTVVWFSTSVRRVETLTLAASCGLVWS